MNMYHMAMDTLEVKESNEIHSSHDTVNEMLIAVKHNNVNNLMWYFCLDEYVNLRLFSSWNRHKRKCFFPKLRWFSLMIQVSMQNQGNLPQLTNEWFYKTVPDGEKILHSWMVCSLVSKNYIVFAIHSVLLMFRLQPPNLWLGSRCGGNSPKVLNHETSEDYLHSKNNLTLENHRGRT